MLKKCKTKIPTKLKYVNRKEKLCFKCKQIATRLEYVKAKRTQTDK